MLICNMFFDERRCFKKLLTSFAPVLALIFLFDIRLNGLGQLSEKTLSIGPKFYQFLDALVVVLPAVVTRIDIISINQQSNFGIEPFQPAVV
jgi:hypothetical protein